MNRYILDWDAYAKVARRAAADGAVLLENKGGVLPLSSGERVALFGRIQLNYYKSGTGSGGLVNTKYVVGIADALLEEEDIVLNKDLLKIYQDWEQEHPFDKGVGWGQEPWCQEEMELSNEVIASARAASDTAIIVIGRTAGEDRDAGAEKGSWFLTDLEEAMLEKVCAAFDRTVVLLNVGGILDLSFIDRYHPSSVMFVWQGGQEGGHAVADLLTGRVNPSGKLSDTIAYSTEDYPSTDNFGGEEFDNYQEDIFVGYRYFETFAKDKVRYPFGYGLSYTKFGLSEQKVVSDKDTVQVSVKVTNEGDKAGKEVVQVYVSAPQGKLGKAARVLIGFAKTSLLAPGESQTLSLEIPMERLASYDEEGVTGYASSYVLEAGTYEIYIGSDVRSAALDGCIQIAETICVRKCREQLRPTVPFKRFHAYENGSGEVALSMEDVPLRTYDVTERIAAETPAELFVSEKGKAYAAQNRANQTEDPADVAKKGDLGLRLEDVIDGKVTVQDFVAQFDAVDLRCIVRGEGMCSSKVTPGTASAFGGVTESLKSYGIPCGCCSDGPSGIRMDCGTIAFSSPNGTCLACTFDEKINEELFSYLGCELRKNQIDTLLGPGINIHRNPLNGRNFEYFSEDPLLTGRIAAGQLNGLHTYGVTGTIKHFATNNQEFHRNDISSNVSERALREIYLKGFEIAVKEGGAYLIMTTYGAINGVFTAGNYELVTGILRQEWGYDGAVMTDWWAKAGSEKGGDEDRYNFAAMVRAQNDLYMVTPDALQMEEKDNLKEAMESGYLTRGMLQRSAVNIVNVLMKSPCALRMLDRISDEEKEAKEQMQQSGDIPENVKYITLTTETGGVTELDVSEIQTEIGSTNMYGFEVLTPGRYDIEMEIKIDASAVAQVPMTIFLDNTVKSMLTFNGTDGEWITKRVFLDDIRGNVFMKLYFAQSGMQIRKLELIRTGDVELSW